MNPIIKHAGGKRRIASRIFEALGKPTELCEPFAGGLAVSLRSGARPVIFAESIPAVRAIYEVLALLPAALWAELDSMPEEIASREEFEALRARFNLRHTPGRYIALCYSCYNGLARFNGSGGFNAPTGKPLPKRIPRFLEERPAYSEIFEGASIHADWREAVAEAEARGIPIYADPPYVGTFGYGGSSWKLSDLHELAAKLPSGSILSERLGVKLDQPPLLGLASVEDVLEAEGFELVFDWWGRDSVSRGERKRRHEGVWEKK